MLPSKTSTSHTKLCNGTYAWWIHTWLRFHNVMSASVELRLARAASVNVSLVTLRYVRQPLFGLPDLT